jgi:hypothetical protein
MYHDIEVAKLPEKKAARKYAVMGTQQVAK